MTGAFISTETLPPSGTTVSMEFLLPSVAPHSGLRLRAKGTVVRIEDDPEPRGFAVNIEAGYTEIMARG
jgi:hypothetical protein